MRIAIPIDEDKSNICQVLGRAPYFLIADTNTNENELKENPATDAQEGAGLKAAQFIVDCKVDALITPRCGANSGEVMKEANIQIYKSEGTDYKENITAFLEKRLHLLESFHSGYHGIR
ncbi:MAG: NifB/NifX family molybdenum-iron cluster-binding protein [Lachnospiraceae bacterium]|nr:NifB/NifX family molybdenum-iron cluster-binding protein [Lachnospiraceae bacterium]